jgi:hypothetical protein
MDADELGGEAAAMLLGLGIPFTANSCTDGGEGETDTEAFSCLLPKSLAVVFVVVVW